MLFDVCQLCDPLYIMQPDCVLMCTISAASDGGLVARALELDSAPNSTPIAKRNMGRKYGQDKSVSNKVSWHDTDKGK